MRIQILDESYELQYKEVKDIDGLLGYMCTTPAHIAIRKGISPCKEASVLVHEIFHAIAAGLSNMEYPLHDNKRIEEHWVEMLSTGLVSVLKANPKLLDKIYDQLRYGK
jgi:hypothetical protein